MNKTNPPQTIALIILDGWGHRTATDHNAIAQAQTPHWDELWQHSPHLLLQGSGHAVGLPDDQMGNSEVGHMTIGSGRVIYQDLTRIDQAIDQGEFASNARFNDAIAQARNTGKALHLLGLLSPGGVHSHERHLQAMLRLAASQGLKNVYLHAFLDGRDVPPSSALASLQAWQALAAELGCGQIVSLTGRYYAMDRDQRWDRTAAAYNLLVHGQAVRTATDPCSALQQAYAASETDEFVQATAIHAPHQAPITLQTGDVVIAMNYRSDRIRQLTRALLNPDFNGFARGPLITFGDFVTLTQYAEDIPAKVAFPPQALTQSLGEYIASLNMAQLRIAETEKYAHVTFFFNGGTEQVFAKEERILIPSPAVATYDLQPEMSAMALTEKLIAAIHSQHYRLIVANFANADMVGHTGNFAATVTAIETLDTCLGRIQQALAATGSEALITADHGNAELMYDHQTEQAHTAHTHELVPLVYYGRPVRAMMTQGKLADVAPTLLYLLGLPIPPAMTGQVLLKLS